MINLGSVWQPEASLRSNSVTRIWKTTKLKIQMRHFGYFSNNVQTGYVQYLISVWKTFGYKMRFFSFLFSVKNHFSHFTLEMEKLSFWVEKRTSELRKWQIDRQQDNFSFLRLTLFAFGFQEIVPNFRWPQPQFWAFKPLKSVQQKWWRKACVFSACFGHFVAFLNSTQGYSTFGSELHSTPCHASKF